MKLFWEPFSRTPTGGGIRKALEPLLGEEHLSKSAVSRLVARLKERFTERRGREVNEEARLIVFLDAFHLKGRLARGVVSAPVLAVLAVGEDGQKRLISLELAVSEAATHWGSVAEDLQRRRLRAPRLLVVDGHKGLQNALEHWPTSKVPRCTQHKWRNLAEHCPPHARHELRSARTAGIPRPFPTLSPIPPRWILALAAGGDPRSSDGTPPHGYHSD